MYLTPGQTVIMILAVALGAVVTRFSPFLLFPEGKELPDAVGYLGKVLPAAMMGLLVVYCLKNVSFMESPHGFAEIVSIGVVVLLYRWKNNVLLSIGAGTAVYMFLVQKIFI